MSQNLNLKIESLEAQLQKCHQTIAMKDSVIKMLKKKLSAKTSHKSRGGMRRKKKRTVKKARKKRNRKRRKTSKKSHTRRLKGGDFYYDNNGEPNPESNWDPECPVPPRPELDYDCDHYMGSNSFARMVDEQIAEARVPNPQNGGKK